MTRYRTSRFWLAVLASAAVPMAFAAPSHEEVLDNGLRVILVEHRANPMIASSVVVGAGLVNEPEEMNGASHFLEHLLFNGTARRDQRALYDEVDRYGAYNNATTREDHTLFTLLIQKEFAAEGLDIQADMLFHSTLPADKFEKEKGIILEEIAKDNNDPAYLASARFRTFAYAGTPLSRPVLGSEASIRQMRREAVLNYYKTFYVPGNMVLLVMGDFDTPEMMRLVKKTFGTAPKGAKVPLSGGRWPKPGASNFSTSRLEAGRVYLHAAFPIRTAPWEAQTQAAELLVASLADGKDSPLSEALTAGADPLVISYSFAVAPRRVPWSTAEFEAVIPKGKDPQLVLRRLAEGIASLRPGSGAWDRIASARTAAKADEVLTADQIQYFSMMRAAYLPGSPPGYLSRRASSLDGVAAADLLAASDLLRSGLGEVRASVAGPDALDGASAWVASADPGARPSAADVRSETLGSGARILVQRNEDSDVFAVHVMFAPRSACEPPGKEGIADFLHRMLPRGTIVRDAAGLSAAFDALGARIKIVDDPAVPFDDYYTTPEFSFVRLEMPSERWREGVTLLGEMLRFPRLSADDIEAVRKEMLDLQKRQGESTRLVAQDLAARTLAPDQPLSRPVLGRAESIASITAEDLRAFHAAYFTGKRMILTAVGPIAPTDVADAVRATFGSMAAGEEAPARAVPPVTPEGSHAEAVVGKGQAYLDLAFVFDPDPKDLAALMVAGALLSDKLTFFLREEKGLAYSAGVSVAPWGGRTKFEAVMGTRQGNVDQALELMRSRLTELVRTEPEAAAVERAANALRGRGLMRRMSRINQAYFAGLDLLDGRAVGENLKRLEAIRAVTRDDVSRVMRGYLDPSRCAVMTVR